MELSDYLKDVPDFPKPGIVFKDISPLLRSPDAYRAAIDAMAEPFIGRDVTAVAGIDSRGFLFGPGIAEKLGVGFVMLRKGGKLPGDVIGVDYELEYGTDRVELVEGLLDESDSVLIVDDVLATGGTLAAACALVRSAGSMVAGVSVLVHLVALNGQSKIPDSELHTQVEVN